MKLTNQAVELLLEAFVANARHCYENWAASGQLPGQTYAIRVENDSELDEHINLLAAAGMVVLDDNDDPMTRDAEPQLMQLTDKAVLWCLWLLHRRHLQNIKVEPPITQPNLDEMLEHLVTGLIR